MEKIDSFSGKYAFLSNFAHSPITRYGITVPTAEHEFHMLKAATYEEMKYVAAAKTASEAKARGRKIKMREDWEQIKYEVMYAIQTDKYKQNPELLKKLLDTGDAELEEGNWWHDNTWGNCHCPNCKNKEGRNMLGKILMKVRDELRHQEEHMIHFVKGNIFDSPAQVIVNPVNCVGVMGAGLAKQFKDRYHNMYRSYVQCCSKGLLEPGKLMLCKEEDHIILLFPTKTHYNMPSKMEYIEKGLEKLADTYRQKNIKSIAIPKLGCGLGGLDWLEVRQRILYYLTDCDMEVYIYE